MNYSFHPSAEKELFDAINYYDDCWEKLGLEFAREIFQAIENILLFPDAWPLFSKNTRRCLIKRFPYGIIYRVRESGIHIYAVMQLNRKPGYWEKRID